MTTILRIIAWLLAAAVTFATLGPPRLRPHAAEFGQDGEHALAFILVGLAFGAAYPRHRLLATVVDEPTVRLVDDLDDLARPRLDDYPAVIDNRVAISGVAGNGPQFDARRQRLAHHDSLPHHNGRSALGLNRRDHGIGDFEAQADRGTYRAADNLADRATDLAADPCAIRCAGGRGGLSERSARRQQRRSHERNSKTLLHPVLLL